MPLSDKQQYLTILQFFFFFVVVFFFRFLLCSLHIKELNTSVKLALGFDLFRVRRVARAKVRIGIGLGLV